MNEIKISFLGRFFLNVYVTVLIHSVKRRISPKCCGQVFSDILYLFGRPRKLNVCALDMDARSSCSKISPRLGRKRGKQDVYHDRKILLLQSDIDIKMVVN